MSAVKERIDICGVLVHAQKGKEQEVEALLSAMNGVDVHHISENSRLIVTIELDGRAEIMEVMSSFNDMPNILSTVLTYQHSEEL
jgi:nitrate reductase NapD